MGSSGVLVRTCKDATIQVVVGDSYVGDEVSRSYGAGQVELYGYGLGSCAAGDVHAEGGADEVLDVDSAVCVVVVEGNVDACYLDEHSLIIDEGYSSLSRIARVETGFVQNEVGGGYRVGECYCGQCCE